MRIATFDLETANSPDDVKGGWSNKKALGISSGVVWVSWEAPTMGRFRLFRGDRIQKLVEILEYAEIVVSFNGQGVEDGKGFDLPLLQAQGFNPRIQLHCDLIRLCARRKRQFVSLDELARHTLGRRKSGHGKHAPQMAREGRWDELFEYNIDDVAITRDLFFFAKAFGFLLDKDERIPLHVPGGVPAWRGQEIQSAPFVPMTERQLSYIRKLRRYRWEAPQGFSKQKASEMIEALLSEKEEKEGLQ